MTTRAKTAKVTTIEKPSLRNAASTASSQRVSQKNAVVTPKKATASKTTATTPKKAKKVVQKEEDEEEKDVATLKKAPKMAQKKRAAASKEASSTTTTPKQCVDEDMSPPLVSTTTSHSAVATKKPAKQQCADAKTARDCAAERVSNVASAAAPSKKSSTLAEAFQLADGEALLQRVVDSAPLEDAFAQIRAMLHEDGEHNLDDVLALPATPMNKKKLEKFLDVPREQAALIVAAGELIRADLFPKCEIAKAELHAQALRDQEKVRKQQARANKRKVASKKDVDEDEGEGEKGAEGEEKGTEKGAEDEAETMENAVPVAKKPKVAEKGVTKAENDNVIVAKHDAEEETMPTDVHEDGAEAVEQAEAVQQNEAIEHQEMVEQTQSPTNECANSEQQGNEEEDAKNNVSTDEPSANAEKEDDVMQIENSSATTQENCVSCETASKESLRTEEEASQGEKGVESEEEEKESTKEAADQQIQSKKEAAEQQIQSTKEAEGDDASIPIGESVTAFAAAYSAAIASVNADDK